MNNDVDIQYFNQGNEMYTSIHDSFGLQDSHPFSKPNDAYIMPDYRMQ